MQYAETFEIWFILYATVNVVLNINFANALNPPFVLIYNFWKNL